MDYLVTFTAALVVRVTADDPDTAAGIAEDWTYSQGVRGAIEKAVEDTDFYFEGVRVFSAVAD